MDTHLLRQTQTAAATKSLIEQPGFPLSSQIPWLGRMDARYVLELPLYNYLIIPVYKLTGQLDLSGKLVSIALWASSFLILQRIWRRCLTPRQTFWANLLFVIVPLGVFYGQAFMPEMLVQTLAFTFIVLTLRYDEDPTRARWTVCAAVGLMGLLVKLPEIAHLYLILAFLVFRREGWKALAHPRYWIAALVTVVAVKAWAGYMDSVNAAHLDEWGSKENLRVFIGTLESRFNWKPWAMVVLYLGAFAVPGLAALAAAYGLWVLLRKHSQQILTLWFFSLVVFYLLWFGNTAARQNYYNLVALALLCALFGIGITDFLDLRTIEHWRRTATVMAVLLVAACAVPGSRYLFKQDRRILAAALWTRNHTTPGDLILFCPNHRWEMIDYEYNAVLAYYSDRPTFVWAGKASEPHRRSALKRARFAVVTLPQPPPQALLAAWYRFRGADRHQPQSTDWLQSNGFRPVTQEDGFDVYKRN